MQASWISLLGLGPQTVDWRECAYTLAIQAEPLLSSSRLRVEFQAWVNAGEVVERRRSSRTETAGLIWDLEQSWLKRKALREERGTGLQTLAYDRYLERKHRVMPPAAAWLAVERIAEASTEDGWRRQPANGRPILNEAGSDVVRRKRLLVVPARSEPVYDLLSSRTRKARRTNCKLGLSFRSQFFHSRRRFSSHAKERSTAHRLGSQRWCAVRCV